MEIWKDIEGYEGYYQVSNLGRVKNIKRNKTISVIIDRYAIVNLNKNGSKKKKYLHRLLAIAFIPNPHNKKCVNHIDGNKVNNSLENLEWCTHSENNKHAMDNKLNQAPRGSKQNFSKLTNDKVLDICRRLDEGEIPINICKDYNVSNRTIYDIKLGNTWSWLTGR